MFARLLVSPKSSWFLLILANILWAVSYVASKFVLRELSATMMLSLRFTLAALLLIPWLIRHRKDLHLRQNIVSFGILCKFGNYSGDLASFTHRYKVAREIPRASHISGQETDDFVTH